MNAPSGFDTFEVVPPPTDPVLLSLPVSRRAMQDFAGLLDVPTDGVDWGYAAHCLLAAIFRDLAPTPFDVLPGRGDLLTIVAVGDGRLAVPQDVALRFADPIAYNAVKWSLAAARPILLGEWSAGETLSFHARVCPMVRKRRHDGRTVEVDVWADWCESQPDTADEAGPRRRDLYVAWLARELARNGAAAIDHIEMERFRPCPVLRRGAAREPHRLVAPEARMNGRLTVMHPEAFGALIVRGVGRHRSFGFGLLHLRP